MIRYLAAYLSAGVVFAAIDAAWITVMGPRLYRPVLQPILADKVAMSPAVVFYLMYIAGIVAIAVAPALKDGPWTKAALTGAMLGLVAYGTYDLTNQATLKLWATKLTLADMAYGALATALAATVAYQAGRWAMRTFG
jgi:uncharacterized membrane protein